LVWVLWSAWAATTAQTIDCNGYDSQIWAQSVLVSDPTRYAALDLDDNGRDCEDLPPGAAPARWTDEIPDGAELTTLRLS